MWILALKSVRAEGVFNRSLFVMEDEVWTVDIEQSIKLLATIFYFRYEAAFAGVATTPGDLLRSVNDSVKNYVDLIRVAIVKLGKKRTTDTCPTSRSMREQCLRIKSVDGARWIQRPHARTRLQREGLGYQPQGEGQQRVSTHRRELRYVDVGAFLHRSRWEDGHDDVRLRPGEGLKA
ncbi:unnamed protein product [Ectocarpus sp. CCAP 1310/34]|nr:unnamed protein product [Ectocarpus sp. CCAP 1310/34]